MNTVSFNTLLPASPHPPESSPPSKIRRKTWLGMAVVWKPRQLLAEVGTGAGMKRGVRPSRWASRREPSRGHWAESQAQQGGWASVGAELSRSPRARSRGCRVCALRPPSPSRAPGSPRPGRDSGKSAHRPPTPSSPARCSFRVCSEGSEGRRVWSSWFLASAVPAGGRCPPS